MRRWAHLIRPGGTVLDLACGQGRHMKHLAGLGHAVTGVDRSPEAIAAAAFYGTAVLADVEGGAWPLSDLNRSGQPRQFDAVVVTNYLWRPLFPVILKSLAPHGVLIYETFSAGNESVGKPSRPAFLLHSGELLNVFSALRVVSFECGFIDTPARFVQRLAAVNEPTAGESNLPPARYRIA